MSIKLDLFDPSCLPEAQAEALSQFVEGVFFPAVERDKSSGDVIAYAPGRGYARIKADGSTQSRTHEQIISDRGEPAG